MYAVVASATVRDREAAAQALQEVVPRVSQARGFLAGYWLSMPDGTGLTVMVFDTQDAARTVAERIGPGEFVTFDSVEVAEVAASA
jgi:hypothetical protein